MMHAECGLGSQHKRVAGEMRGSLCTGHTCGGPREGGGKLVYLKSCFPSISCGKCAGLRCYTTGYISTLGKLTPLEG